jgi:hypothetical protein
MRFLSEADAAGYTPPPRLNIIFHGLMAFRELDSQNYEVMIPADSSGVHRAMYGNPREHPVCDPEVCLKSFLRGDKHQGPPEYYMDGVQSVASDRICSPSPANALIMQNSLLIPQYNAVGTLLRVPKPFIIRHYRGAETHGRDLAHGHAPTQGVITPPDVVHGVTVFSYFAFYHPKLVGPGGHAYHVPHFDDFWNLCIYSQPLDQCLSSDSGLFNSMFQVKGTGGAPQVDLSLVGLTDDEPPSKLATNVGIHRVELRSLCELWQHAHHGKGEDITAAPGGCGSGFLKG